MPLTNDYYANVRQASPIPSMDKARSAKPRVDDFDTGDVLGAAAREAMIPFALKRIWERRSAQFEKSDNFAITEKMSEDFRSIYNKSDTKYLEDSNSKDELAARHRFIAEDKKRLSDMAKGGWVGGASLLAFYMLDPVSIAASLASGGLGFLQKGSALARMSKYALTTGTEAVLLDSMLLGGSTQWESSDLIMSFGAGAVIGGTIGALSRSVNPRAAREADQADHALRIDAENKIIHDQMVTNLPAEMLPIKKAHPEADAVIIIRDMDEHESALRAGVAGGLNRGQAKQISKQVEEIKLKIEVENERLRSAQGEVSLQREAASSKRSEFAENASPKREALKAKHGATISKAEEKVSRLEDLIRRKETDKRAGQLFEAKEELTKAKKARDVETAKLETSLKRSIKKVEKKFTDSLKKASRAAKETKRLLTEQLSDAQARLEVGRDAKTSANSLRKWNKMTEQEKVDILYGDEGPPSLKVEAERQRESLQGTLERDAAEKAERGKAGSVGAAESGFTENPVPEIHKLDTSQKARIEGYERLGIDQAEDVRGAMLPWKSKVTDAIMSVQARISNSHNFAIRGFGYLLFEAPQGGKAAAATIASRVKNGQTMIRGAMRNRLNENMRVWGAENGLSSYKSLMVPSNINKYHKEVMLELYAPGTSSSPAIKAAAEGGKDQFYKGGKIWQDANGAGMENVDLNKPYVPVIQDSVKIKNALRNNEESTVREVLSLGYQRGGFQLEKDLADRVADAHIQRAKDDTLVMAEQGRKSTNKDIQDLVDQLKKAGVEDDVVDDFLKSSMDTEVRQHMSNRAKKSLRPNITVESNGLKYIDLIVNDLPRILESYTRDAAGGAAFAKIGLTTRSQVLDEIAILEKRGEDIGQNASDLKREIKILRDGVDMAYGRTLNPVDESGMIKALSRVRSATSLLRLQFVGAASIPELARITSQRQLSSVLEAVKDLGAIRGTKHLREGGEWSGHLKREDLDELEDVIMYNGEDHILYPNGLRADDIEEAEGASRIAQYFDNALAQGRRIGEVASGFRLIQGTGERLAVRALAIDIKKMMKGGKSLLSEAEINSAGWHDGFLDEVKQFMKDNPKTAKINGREIDMFNFGKMTPDMQERLQIGMHRITMRQMQRPMIGEMPQFMNRWLGQTMTQFRSFSILSMEKQLVHDIRHDKVMGALIGMQSAMYGFMAVGIASLQRNLGKDNAEEKILSDMTGSNLTLGILNRMGQLAAVGIGMDGLATLGVLPDALLSGRDQVGARAMTNDSVPVIGVAKDVFEAQKVIMQALTGDETMSRAIKEVQDIAPFAKTIGINQGINALRGIVD